MSYLKDTCITHF